MDAVRARVFVASLAVVELLVGVALLSGLLTSASAAVSMGLLAAFATMIALVLIVWGDVDCGCFGSIGQHPSGWIGVVRNMLLILTALVSFEWGNRLYSIDGSIGLSSSNVHLVVPVSGLALAAAILFLCVAAYTLTVRHLAHSTINTTEKSEPFPSSLELTGKRST
jgi:hypothetical protein